MFEDDDDPKPTAAKRTELRAIPLSKKQQASSGTTKNQAPQSVSEFFANLSAGNGETTASSAATPAVSTTTPTVPKEPVVSSSPSLFDALFDEAQTKKDSTRRLREEMQRRNNSESKFSESMAEARERRTVDRDMLIIEKNVRQREEDSADPEKVSRDKEVGVFVTKGYREKLAERDSRVGRKAATAGKAKFGDEEDDEPLFDASALVFSRDPEPQDEGTGPASTAQAVADEPVGLMEEIEQHQKAPSASVAVPDAVAEADSSSGKEAPLTQRQTVTQQYEAAAAAVERAKQERRIRRCLRTSVIPPAELEDIAKRYFAEKERRLKNLQQ